MADTTEPTNEALIDEMIECAKGHRRTFADFMLAKEALRTRLAALTERAAEERAERVLRGKMLVRLRNKLIHTTDTLVDEGDRVYFASTNDADELRERVKELDAFKWDLILSEGEEPDPLAQLRKMHERAEKAEADKGFDDETADKILGWLAAALNVSNWDNDAATETWDGDVGSVLGRILVQADVVSDWDGAIATHAKLKAAEAALAECRAKVTEECAAVANKLASTASDPLDAEAYQNAASAIRALADKEAPTNG